MVLTLAAIGRLSERTNPAAAVIAVLATIAIPLAAGQPRELIVSGAYVHVPSGRLLPVQVGAFRRAKIFQYDEAGRDVSVGYNLEDSPARLIAATVYLYPSPGRAFSDELAEIKRAHASLQPSFEQEIVLERGARRLDCHMAGFSYSEMFAHRFQPVSSYLLICDDAGWRIKWRFSHVPTADQGITRVMKELAASVTIPE